MEIHDRLGSYFASAEMYYWRIAVAKPVSRPLSLGSRAKLFSSLNRRSGALEMRARRLPVLWTLAFYWFNLSLSRSYTSAPLDGYATTGPLAFSRPHRHFPEGFRGCRGFGVLCPSLPPAFIDMLNALNFLLVGSAFLSNTLLLSLRDLWSEVHSNEFSLLDLCEKCVIT